jgi:hypothetical protein
MVLTAAFAPTGAFNLSADTTTPSNEPSTNPSPEDQ